MWKSQVNNERIAEPSVIRWLVKHGLIIIFSLIVKADKIRDIIDMQKGEFCMVIKSSLPNGNMWNLDISRKMLYDCQW